MFKRLNFKIKVLIPIIAIFIISVLFIAYIDYRMLSSAIKRKTNANLEMFADNVTAHMNHLDIILGSTKHTLNEKNIAIAKTIVYILDNTRSNISANELKELAELLDIIEINIADKGGYIILSNFPEFVGDDYKTTDTTAVYMLLAEGIAKELSEEPRASILPDFSYGEITHFTGVARSAGGFVQLGFNADVIRRLQEQINIDKTIKETRIGDNGFGLVLTSGIIAAHPNDDLIGKDVTKEQWYNSVKSGSGFEWIEIDSEKYYAGYKNINHNTIVGLVARDDYYRELNRILIETIRLLVFSIIIITIVVFLVLGKLLVPIKHLVKGLGKIAASNLDARIEGSYNDEFDEIKDAVNSMAEDLKVHMNLISGIEYASKIQRNLLPSESSLKESFEDYSCIWKPKDIVGGDIYWMKSFPQGTVFCACDCTGHGTPGALLTVLVVSAFEAVVTMNNYCDTAQIIWELEKKLVSELNVDTNSAERGLTINDGCDLAVLFFANDGSVSISSGNTNVFICNGEKVTRLRGQKIRVGDGTIKKKEEIEIVKIPADPKNKYFITTDGLYEQIGITKNEVTGKENKLPFGFNRLKEIILENHGKNLNVISDKVWQAFEEYRGDAARRDDIQFISIKPRIQL